MALRAARRAGPLFTNQPLASCLELIFLKDNTPSSRRISQVSTAQEIYGACVLERLPIVQQPAPDWEAEYKDWARQRREGLDLFKKYPQPEGKKQSRGTDNPEDDFKPVPSVTKADQSGNAATMKRQLASKLVLLVKQQSVAGSSSSGWTFPHARHESGETIRATAERALRECIGVSQVYFIGNAPMAHLPLESSTSGSSSGSSSSSEEAKAAESSSNSSTTGSITTSSSSSPSGPSMFFHLAQVVNDPWEVVLKDGVASDHAWVSPEELPQYIKDARLLDLAKNML